MNYVKLRRILPILSPCKKSGFSWILSSFRTIFQRGFWGLGRALWILYAPGFLLSQNFGADYVMYYSSRNF